MPATVNLSTVRRITGMDAGGAAWAVKGGS